MSGSLRGGIADAVKFESGGFFMLSWRKHQSITSGDLGRGSYETTARFFTEEGRMYFMQAESLRETCAELANKLDWAESQLLAIEEKREQRRKKRLERLGA